MTRIPIVVLTADGWRHRFVANTLADHFDVRGVVSEAKRPVPAGQTAGEDAVIHQHFTERDRKEVEYFGEHETFRVAPERLLAVAAGEANSERVFRWVTARVPRYIVLFGTSIIRDPLLGHYTDRMINLHLGLSPYYRGAGTNFWPLVHGEPECVGATVHLAVLRVDAGPILGQARPEVRAGDGSHDIGNRAIAAGARLLATALKAYAADRVRPRPQAPGGRLFRGRDFTHEAVLRMWENFRNGMIEAYLADQEARQRRYPIVEIG